MEPDDGTLFLSIEGGPFHLDRMSMLAREYVEQAQSWQERRVPHAAAHHGDADAGNGADIRYIQEMLGHSDLQSTQIYTHVAIRQLKKIHEATHPGASLEKKKPASSSVADARGRIAQGESLGSSRRGSRGRIRIERTWGRQATEGSFCRAECGKARAVSRPRRITSSLSDAPCAASCVPHGRPKQEESRCIIQLWPRM